MCVSAQSCSLFRSIHHPRKVIPGGADVARPDIAGNPVSQAVLHHTE